MAENLVISDLLKKRIPPPYPAGKQLPIRHPGNQRNHTIPCPGKIYRSIQRGAVEVTMRRNTNKGYIDYKDSYDILALVTDGGLIAYLHREEIGKSVCLRITRSKNNQTKHVKKFNKYKCINAAIIRARDKSDSRLGEESTRDKERS